MIAIIDLLEENRINNLKYTSMSGKLAALSRDFTDSNNHNSISEIREEIYNYLNNIKAREGNEILLNSLKSNYIELIDEGYKYLINKGKPIDSKLDHNIRFIGMSLDNYIAYLS